jgi:hypothetical protein
MFVELAVLGAAIGIYNHYFSSESKFISRFDSVMEGVGVVNKQGNTFTIRDLETTRYGYKATLNIPYGLSVSHIENKINILEDNLNGIVNIEKDRFKDNTILRIVDRDIDKFMFKPAKCPTSKLWIGKDFKGDNYFLDLNKDPHVLIGGTTGTGKSFLLASILTNLIYNYPKDVEIYLSQICKGEIGAFTECQPVKFVAYNMAEVFVGLKKVCKKLDERSNLFTKYGIRNITQWNKHFPNKRMKRIVYVLEELSFFMEIPDVWEYVLKMVKAGRSCGIHLIGLLQRSTASNLPPDVKSQMTRITFKQKSVIDSQNIINTTGAIKLKDRECLVDSNNGLELVKTPYIDEDFITLNKYVPEIRIPTNEEKEDNIIIEKEDEEEVIRVIETPLIVEVDYKALPEGNFKARKGIIEDEEGEDIC